MVEAKIKALRDELEQHNYNYYVLSTPTISDREFDEKMKNYRHWRKLILNLPIRIHRRSGWEATCRRNLNR